MEMTGWSQLDVDHVYDHVALRTRSKPNCIAPFSQAVMSESRQC
jgi:hypothetical protein